MKNRLLPLGLLAAVAASVGCRKMPDPVCTSKQLAPIVQVSGPRQAAVNQIVSYQLKVQLGNSCGVFDSVVVSAGDNTTGPFMQQVGVRGRYTGCTCQADTTVLTPVTYQFRPANAGIYYLKFLSRQSLFITDTLLVQ